MSLQLPGWDDTIVALATPPGVGALGIVRLSGKTAIDIVASLFPSKNLRHQSSHTLHVGYLKDENQMLDEVVVSLYKTPRSYTGEDVVEISCHGSPYILKLVIDACINKGARLAKPGEFTQRAFLAGKLDLAQAEAVADLISSTSKAAHKTALNNMRGGFSHSLKDLRRQLIKFSALIELELDFSQEDVEFADRGQLKDLVSEARRQNQRLLDSFQLGNAIKNGVSVAIIGKPNAGKSTLLNSLLNEDRAIVSDIPGTTRDTVEEVINIEGILFRLIDTAGIRSHSTDVIESAGIKRSLEKMNQADLVLYLFDVNSMTLTELLEEVSNLHRQNLDFLLVANKIDLLNEAKARLQFSAMEKVIYISAKSGLHIESLKEKILNLAVHEMIQGEDVIVTNARHYQSLQEVQRSLLEVDTGLENQISGDLLALDIRRCLYYLGVITGQISNDELLDFVFTKFCIGK
ncbi:MAG TPA: tRNA uridine-5-carboxymethylaminomethyl(34) synthesis GTPase MnmE [Flavisolibacter sp.]|nr:tRNA uridine-5-carboxymethylaminomethyl(34) synthesis GTPase MnmE [Flavisolibacter sp.]